MKKIKSLNLETDIVKKGLNQMKLMEIKVSFSQYVEELILKDWKKNNK